jgi:hypothetical protein
VPVVPEEPLLPDVPVVPDEPDEPEVAEVPDVPEVPDEPSPPVEPSRFMSHALYVPEPTTCVGVPNTRAPVIGLYVVTTVS